MLLDYSIHFMVIEKLQLRLCLCINWNFKSVWILLSLFIQLLGKSPTGPRKWCFNSWTADICSWLGYYEVVIQSLNFSLWMASCNWKLFPKFHITVANLTCSLWNRPETVETWNSFNITSGILMLWMQYQYPNSGAQKNKKQKRQESS